MIKRKFSLQIKNFWIFSNYSFTTFFCWNLKICLKILFPMKWPTSQGIICMHFQWASFASAINICSMHNEAGKSILKLQTKHSWPLNWSSKWSSVRFVVHTFAWMPYLVADQSDCDLFVHGLAITSYSSHIQVPPYKESTNINNTRYWRRQGVVAHRGRICMCVCMQYWPYWVQGGKEDFVVLCVRFAAQKPKLYILLHCCWKWKRPWTWLFWILTTNFTSLIKCSAHFVQSIWS